MKRNISSGPSTSAALPPTKRIVPSPLPAGKPQNNTEIKSILEQGKIYFTPIGGISMPLQESEGALSLNDILCTTRPVKSLHLSFIAYPPSLRSTPITLVVGQQDAAELRRDAKTHPNIKVIGAHLPIPFGTHHSKLSILESENGKVHVIVSTANMVPDDWEIKTQLFFYAFGEKRLSTEQTEKSPFQEDLVEYLSFYKNPMTSWKELIEKTDFSQVKDRLIFSAPGKHEGTQKDRLGHRGLYKILCEQFPFDPNYQHTEKTTFISQCSSIGSIGKVPNDWLRSEFLKSLEGNYKPPMNLPAHLFLIYPCVEDVRKSCTGYQGGGSLPYREVTHNRQTWLRDYMLKWRADKNHRTQAMPHCKTYVKYDKKVPKWQLVTSANLSKAAWGAMTKATKTHPEQFMIRSFEIGVLITDPARFNIPYDYPCVKYGKDDEPFMVDKTYLVPDILGQLMNA